MFWSKFWKFNDIRTQHAKLSQKYYNVHHIRKNYVVKSINDDETKCINDTLSNYYGDIHKLIK